MMPEIVRRVPEILRRCYHEDVVEICRRKSASSSAEDQENFFQNCHSDSNPRPLDFRTGYLATVPYEKGSRRCWYNLANQFLYCSVSQHPVVPC